MGCVCVCVWVVSPPIVVAGGPRCGGLSRWRTEQVIIKLRGTLRQASHSMSPNPHKSCEATWTAAVAAAALEISPGSVMGSHVPERSAGQTRGRSSALRQQGSRAMAAAAATRARRNPSSMFQALTQEGTGVPFPQKEMTPNVIQRFINQAYIGQ